MHADREEVIRWACDLLASNDWVILDTETTGLYGADIVQLAILSSYGHALLDVLIEPSQLITPGAAAVHGLRAEHLAGALDFARIYPALVYLLSGRRVLIYNAAFDTQILAGICQRVGLPALLLDVQCVMLRYAAYVGEWSDYHGDYRWQRLPGGDHQAIGDCRAVLRLLQQMAATPLPGDPSPAEPTSDEEDFPF